MYMRRIIIWSIKNRSKHIVPRVPKGLMPSSMQYRPRSSFAPGCFQDRDVHLKLVESHRAFPFSSRQSAPTRVSSLVRYIRSRCAKTRLFSAVEGAEADGRQNEYDRGGFGISNERKRFVGSVLVRRVPRKRDLSISSSASSSFAVSLPSRLWDCDPRRDVFPHRPSPCRSRIRAILPDARQISPDLFLCLRQSCVLALASQRRNRSELQEQRE